MVTILELLSYYFLTVLPESTLQINLVSKQAAQLQASIFYMENWQKLHSLKDPF